MKFKIFIFGFIFLISYAGSALAAQTSEEHNRLHSQLGSKIVISQKQPDFLLTVGRIFAPEKLAKYGFSDVQKNDIIHVHKIGNMWMVKQLRTKHEEKIILKRGGFEIFVKKIGNSKK